jgi:hypothetical protein
MSFSSLRATIETLFSTNWTHTSVEYDNVPIDLEGVNEYVSLAILEGESVQTSLGTDGEYKIPGFVVISVFTQREVGTVRSRVLSDYVATIFRGVKIDTVLFSVPKGSRIHNKTNYFQYNVTVPFTAYFSI